MGHLHLGGDEINKLLKGHGRSLMVGCTLAANYHIKNFLGYTTNLLIGKASYIRKFMPGVRNFPMSLYLPVFRPLPLHFSDNIKRVWR